MTEILRPDWLDRPGIRKVLQLLTAEGGEARFVGGSVRWLVDRKRKGESAAEAEFSPGMLMASGLIAGGAILGVVQSVILVGGWDKALDLSGAMPASLITNHTWWPLLPFLLMAGGLYYVGTQKK